MANNTNTATLGNLTSLVAPDVAAEQVALQRRQELIDALKKQALSPLESQTITGAGPARVVPISPIQGLAKMLTAYNAGQGQKEVDSKNLALQRQYAQQMSAILGGGAPQGAPQGQGDPSAMPQGDPAGQPQPSMGGQPAGSPQGSNAFGLANLLRGSVVGQVGGEQAGKAYWDQYSPTAATKAALQGNMDPVTANRLQFIKETTDPKILSMKQAGLTDQQIYGAVFGEAAKNAETERKSGNQFKNFLTGDSGQVPHIPPNTNPVGPVAPNGALPGGVTPMAGAVPAVQATAQASARGGAVGGFHSIQTPSGGTVVVPGDQIAPASDGPQTLNTNNAQTNPDLAAIYGGELKAAQARLAAAKTQDEVQRAQADISSLQREQQRAGIPQGQGTGAKKVAEASGEYIATAPAQIQALKQSVTGLENAYSSLDKMGKSGPGVSGTVQVAAVLNNLGLPVGKDSVQNFQTLKKFLANSANTAAGANGSNGSDARLDQFLSGQPNPDAMNVDSLKGAIRYVLSQHDAGIAERSSVMQRTGGDPSKVQQVRQDFAQQYSPRVFEFSRMTPDERKASVKAMTPQQLDTFKKQYNAAHQQGWVQ